MSIGIKRGTVFLESHSVEWEIEAAKELFINHYPQLNRKFSV